MTSTVDDDMLMAFVDGELDEATAETVRRAIRSDASLARRAEVFRASRQAAREAYAPDRAEPVPERLVAAVLATSEARSAPPARGAFARAGMRWRAGLPLAAALALAFGLGGYWIGSAAPPEPGALLGPGALAGALGATASGETADIRLAGEPARLAVLGAYGVGNGLCRTFEITGGPNLPVRGVGCAFGGQWQVDLAVQTSGGDGFSPAGSGAAGSLEAYLDQLGAEGPLAPEEEARAARAR